MSRPAAVTLCAFVLVLGFVAGRLTGSSSGTVTIRQTVDRVVVVRGRHVGAARDSCAPGALDLAHISSVRRGIFVDTTIAACRAWRDALLSRGRAALSILYDTNMDGTPERRDRVFLFQGRLTSWVSSLGQGVQAADVTRRGTTTVTVARDASVFFNEAGQAGLLATAPIGVAVVAHWKGGRDRVPDRGWITVPPPAG